MKQLLPFLILSLCLCQPSWAQNTPPTNNTPTTSTTTTSTTTSTTDSTSTDAGMVDVSEATSQVEEDPATGDAAEDAISDWSIHSPYYDSYVTNRIDLHNDASINIAHSSGNSRNIDVGTDILNIVSYMEFINSFNFGIDYSQSGFTGAPLSVVNRHIYVDEQLEWHHYTKIYALYSFDWHTDKPSGMDAYYSSNLGVGYFVIENETFVLRPELSYHLSHENQSWYGIDQTLNSLLASLRFNWNITDTSSFSTELDYLVDLSQGSNFRLNLTASMNLTIYKNIYCEPQFTLRFDNEPVFGNKKYDTSTNVAIGITF